MLGAAEHAAADFGIFAFHIFAHDIEVDVIRSAAGERALSCLATTRQGRRLTY